MKKDTLEDIFQSLEGTFDVEETPKGHQQRFMDKLNMEKPGKVVPIKKSNPWKLISIAASIVLLISFGFFFSGQETPAKKDLASISPEMQDTQSFYTATINKELQKLIALQNNDTKVLVDDALLQLKILEDNYDKLLIDLEESGNDKRVMYALITNFKNRIDLLEHVIETIEDIKHLKESKNETTI